MKRTYEPKTICVKCFNVKGVDEIPPKCWMGDRHKWNAEPFTVEVEVITETSEANR